MVASECYDYPVVLQHFPHRSCTRPNILVELTFWRKFPQPDPQSQLSSTKKNVNPTLGSFPNS